VAKSLPDARDFDEQEAVEQEGVGRHAVPGECDQSLRDVGRQRRRADVEAELNRGSYLIDILTARTRSPNDSRLNVAFVTDAGFGDP
jgi:hypothetical protein